MKIIKLAFTLSFNFILGCSPGSNKLTKNFEGVDSSNSKTQSKSSDATSTNPPLIAAQSNPQTAVNPQAPMQSAPPLSIVSIEKGLQSELSFKSSQFDAHSEVPPVLLQGAWRGVLLSTGWTIGCASPNNPLLSLPLLTNCYVASVSKMHNGTKSNGVLAFSSGNEWTQNYNGIYSAHLMRDSVNWILAFNHNEVKNEWLPNLGGVKNPFLNIDPAVCSSSVVNGVYQDCYDAYMAFISSAWTPYTEDSKWGLQNFQDDRGPVVWPSDGYFDNLGKAIVTGAGLGVRHPSSLIWNNAVYLFYLDQSLGSWGIKIARSEKAGLPGTFFSLKDGKFTEPSLPVGFLKDSVRDFLGKKGPQSAPLFKDEKVRSQNRFSVAKVKGAEQFIGVEESYFEEKWGLSLRVSTNLLDWSDRVDIPGTFADWQNGKIHYPNFVNQDFTDNYEVDLANFSVMGTTAEGKVTVLKLKTKLNR